VEKFESDVFYVKLHPLSPTIHGIAINSIALLQFMKMSQFSQFLTIL